MTITLIILAALAVLCFLYILSIQRKLVKLEELMKNALGQINAQLKTRWDAVTSLVQMTKQYTEHEHDTLMDVIAQRRMESVSSPDDVNDQNNAIGSVLGRLSVVAEQYPQLKADGIFKETMGGIQRYEENVRLSRMVYNDSVTKLNTLVRQWPSSFVASMLHVKAQNYIEEDKKVADAPDISKIFKGEDNAPLA
ncbi:MAG: LemA family protein [Candidatus Cryptobacteroides sp.]|jgi:LemA protein|nr:LemA family protein [Bacteroidota bacterium]NLN98723.1 LemA family protein [Bacteroidales bacterium]